MASQDRRIRRTEQLLATALIALTLEKGYELVTIRDITERADVGYATFFRHYHDKDELLHDVLNEVLAEFQSHIAPTMSADQRAEVGVLLFRYAAEQSDKVRVLLGSRPALQWLVVVVSEQLVREQPPRADSVVPLEVAVQHIANATIALIAWWLERQMPYSPERMGQIYYELIIRPTHALVFAA